MSEKVHLKNCFLGRHRLETEGLRADGDIAFLLYRLASVRRSGYIERGILETALNACFVLSYLTFDVFNTFVECAYKRRILFFAAEQSSFV